MNVYFDNAATTQIDKEVLEAMLPFMERMYGNPSSTHAHGREIKTELEKARRTVAGLLNATPAEIFFTSGGTESDNTAIRGSIRTHGITHAITSKLEHHAVLHTLEELHAQDGLNLSFVEHDANGVLNLNHLESLLKENPKSLVSLMHGNNEIGNILDIDKVGEICQEYEAYFHSDTVQTVGHFHHDLQKTNIDAILGAAHKFHGPKGVGFLYLKKKSKVQHFISGGSQERGMRGGTENVYGIIGLAKAMELSLKEAEEHKIHLLNLKQRMIEGLKNNFKDIGFNGLSSDLENSLPTVLNVCFPSASINEMLLFNLDLHNISASGGSACSSGSNQGSHVLNALGVDSNRASVRFSFSKYNTLEEVDYTLEKLKELYADSEVLV